MKENAYTSLDMFVFFSNPVTSFQLKRIPWYPCITFRVFQIMLDRWRRKL